LSLLPARCERDAPIQGPEAVQDGSLQILLELPEFGGAGEIDKLVAFDNGFGFSTGLFTAP
jgi:hypothetical protein